MTGNVHRTAALAVLLLTGCGRGPTPTPPVERAGPAATVADSAVPSDRLVSWTEPKRLRSGVRGAVVVQRDPKNGAYALVRTSTGTWRLPAGAALGVLEDERLDEGQRVEALLTYPGVVRIE